jgi:hypothetical protein
VSEDDAYARKEGFPTKIVMSILGAIVIILWFVIGQGYFSTPLSDTSPPTIWLVYEGQLYSGVRGSYCWADKCVDTMFQEPVGVVEVTQGSSVELFMNSRIRPTALSAPIYVIDSLGNPAQVGELVGDENEKYKIDLQKGVYILQLFASWEELGDVTYAFKIKVN